MLQENGMQRNSSLSHTTHVKTSGDFYTQRERERERERRGEVAFLALKANPVHRPIYQTYLTAICELCKLVGPLCGLSRDRPTRDPTLISCYHIASQQLSKAKKG